jgi:hypothetical protein
MASLRERVRADGSEYFSVLYRLSGKLTSMLFEDFGSAKTLCDLATKFGPAKPERPSPPSGPNPSWA